MNTPNLLRIALFLMIVATAVNGQEVVHGRNAAGAGGDMAVNDRLVLRNTVGQPVISDATVSRTLLQQGFWFRMSRGIMFANHSATAVAGLSLAMTAQPNPFSESTELVVSIPTPGPVMTLLYDAKGVAVRTFADWIYQPGTVTIPVDGAHLPSGTYLVVLMAGGQHVTTTLRLVK